MGEDELGFSIPSSSFEGYQRAVLEVLHTGRGGAEIGAAPRAGEAGDLSVRVRWWVEGNLFHPGSVGYRIWIYSAIRLPTYVRFRASSGTYLSASDGGGGDVTASGAQPDEGSRFIVTSLAEGDLLGGTPINLLSASGHYVVAARDSSHAIRADSLVPAERERFQIVNAAWLSSTGQLGDGAQVALRTSDQTYVRADGALTAQGTAITPAHTFTLELVSGLDVETPSTGLAPPPPLDYFVDAVRAYVRGHQIPAATVAIFKDGKRVFLRGYGYLDEGRRQLTLPSTIMLLASIDKHVTAVAIETWMARSGGAIRKHTKYFPFLRALGVQPHGGSLDDPRVDKITFQHLLTGYSGLDQARPDSLGTPEEQASWVMAHGLRHEPGMRYEYPNLENDLLRFAMFKQLGGREPFLRFLRDHVTGPVGSGDIDLLADDPRQLNPREPWYKGAAHTYPNRHLLLTASAEALGRLFSRFRQGDGRPIGKDSPRLSAFDIVSVPPTPATVFRVNCGGPEISAGGKTWRADCNYTPDGSWAHSATSPIANAEVEALYQTDRWGNIDYRIDVGPGTYDVTLRFADTYWSNAGERLFCLALNDDTVLVDFDIVREAGGRDRAVDRTFRIPVEEGEGISISARPSWGGEIYWGGFPGTTALVHQIFDQGIVNVALFDASDPVGDMSGLLGADTLIGKVWP